MFDLYRKLKKRFFTKLYYLIALFHAQIFQCQIFCDEIKHIIHFYKNVRYLFCFNIPKAKNGFVFVSHESNTLGACKLALHICKELKRQNIDFFIISRKFGELNDDFASVANLIITPGKTLFSLILRLFKQFGYQNIIFNTSVNGDLVPIAKRLGYKTLVLVHETLYMVRLQNMDDRIGLINGQSDVVVYPTNILYNEHQNQFGIPSGKVCICPQGLYLHIYKYPLSQSKHVLGVGNTTERKGFDLFVKIASLLPSVEFLWIGRKEPFLDTVFYGNLENFHYLGELNSDREIGNVYANSIALALTSRSDTFPSTMIEAMSYGVPVVGFRSTGGIEEIVKEGENGYMINAFDLESFAHRLSLLSNLCGKDKETISICCKATASNYNLDNYVRSLISYLS